MQEGRCLADAYSDGGLTVVSYRCIGDLMVFSHHQEQSTFVSCRACGLVRRA